MSKYDYSHVKDEMVRDALNDYKEKIDKYPSIPSIKLIEFIIDRYTKVVNKNPGIKLIS